jgi:hypothetical protein
MNTNDDRLVYISQFKRQTIIGLPDSLINHTRIQYPLCLTCATFAFYLCYHKHRISFICLSEPQSLGVETLDSPALAPPSSLGLRHLLAEFQILFPCFLFVYFHSAIITSTPGPSQCSAFLRTLSK